MVDFDGSDATSGNVSLYYVTDTPTSICNITCEYTDKELNEEWERRRREYYPFLEK